MIYFLSLILFLLPSYLIRLRVFNLPTTVLEILLIIFLFCSLFSLDKESLKKIRSLGNINWAAALFILAGIIAAIIAPEKAKALGMLKAFIIEPVLFFYAILLTVKNQKSTSIVLGWLLSSSTIISLFGIIQYFTFIHLPLRFWGTGAEVERITSVFEYPNALALYLAPLFVFFFALWLKKSELVRRKWLYLSLPILVLTLILTFSRGAWLAVIFVVFMLYARQFKFKQWLIPAVSIIILIFLINPVRDRVLLGASDASSLVHLSLWGEGIRQISASPFFGSGLGGFHSMSVDYPHNIFLNFWLELGLLGLIAFAWIINFTLDEYKKNQSFLNLAAGMFLLVMVIHGLFDVPYFKNDLSILFWFMISLFYLPNLSHSASKDAV